MCHDFFGDENQGEQKKTTALEKRESEKWVDRNSLKYRNPFEFAQTSLIDVT